LRVVSDEAPQVTVVVVPRERFSHARQTLEAIYAHTHIPFELVYVDAGSPRSCRRHLEAESARRGFELVRVDHYLTPSRSRNLGLRSVRTPYVVFLDNDVRVGPGWLDALVRCADETNAALVGSLIVEATDPDDLIHYGGGDAGIRTTTEDGARQRQVYKQNPWNGQRISQVLDQLKRQPTGFVEFHCALLRTDLFERVGVLDESLHCEDHLDFSLRVQEAGETIYFEPASYVTYVPGPLEWTDIPYYLLRWGVAWHISSYRHLANKWNVVEGEFFTQRYGRMRRFREVQVIEPLSRRLLRGRFQQPLKRALLGIEWAINPLISSFYDWREVRRQAERLRRLVD
jgi:GT2 family glycosyltransferase